MLRGQKRINCHIPTRIIAGEQENIGCIVDLARNGCRCIIEKSKNPDSLPLDLDEKLLLRCVFPETDEIITIAGEVKNLKRTRKELDIGVSFTDDTPVKSMKIITWFLDTI